MINMLLCIAIAYGTIILVKDCIKLKKEISLRNKLKHISTKSNISIEEFNNILSIRA